MKMNRAETLVMNNPVRALLQRHYERGLLERLGGRVDGCKVLEIGCGRGVGAEMLLERMGAARVDAFDLDESMVAAARARLRRFGNRARVEVGDATQIDSPGAAYDAVFDFGIVHHVPQWRDAIAEVRRVLVPGGRFFFEEVTNHALGRPLYQKLFDHPVLDRFGAAELLNEIEAQGMWVRGNYVTRFFGDFIIGVAVRA